MHGAFGKDEDLPFSIYGYATQMQNQSYKELAPKQVCRIHENEKKRMYNERVTDIEQGTFTPLIFTTTGGMGTVWRLLSVFWDRMRVLVL